ncbi:MULTISPECIES: DUF5625 family protein [unclassified Bradyrhizobium]|uniref:DUF5625 family protein n=1 Tax=unclassified Bradyrhizobium TaxID=2631580 RepID=UPI002FF1A0F4
MKRRSRTQMLAAVTVTLIVLLVLTIYVRSLYGVSPYAQFLKLIYSDVPVQVVPVELVEGTPFTFRTRIIQRNIYYLSLLVYFDNAEQRVRVDDLIGGPVGQPGNVARPPGKLQTVIRIVVRDLENRAIYDRTVRPEGRNITGATYLGRRLDTIELSEGIYEVSVTPLSDMSRLAPFRTALEIYYLFK